MTFEKRSYVNTPIPEKTLSQPGTFLESWRELSCVFRQCLRKTVELAVSSLSLLTISVNTIQEMAFRIYRKTVLFLSLRYFSDEHLVNNDGEHQNLKMKRLPQKIFVQQPLFKRRPADHFKIRRVLRRFCSTEHLLYL